MYLSEPLLVSLDMVREEGGESRIGDASKTRHTACRPKYPRGAEKTEHGQLAGLEGKPYNDGVFCPQARDQ